MALKTKGTKLTPKAGPKKRRAKTEAEAIRRAVDEHGAKLRKTRKVRSYTYKQVDEADKLKKQRGKQIVSEQERLYGLRVPDGPSEFDVFKEALPKDAKVFAEMYWHMQCAHAHQEDLALTTSIVEGAEPSHVRCLTCGMVRKWWGTKTLTKQKEWIGYCPDGYDMFDWEGLFVKDRSLWQFIHDEVLAEMAEASMTTEEDAA